MTKVYVMSTCPDCVQVKAQLANHPDYELIDIGEHVRHLKAFLRLRDSHPAFDAVKARGAVGIPCFVDEQGNVSFDADAFCPAATAPAAEEIAPGAACNLDGTGC